MHLLAVIQQTVGQQLGLLPVGGRHVLLPVSFLEGFTDPHAPQLAHQGVLNIPLQGRQGSRACIPGSHGESGLVSRGSQGLRSPLESRRGSLGAP